ncbi:MAG: thiosulfate/3-mercaptopyruvate sulfurtransferase [Ascidiaceihabitans sp.]|jgi:thiosulfate/3-mercaptopyruvate sulfurtransferase
MTHSRREEKLMADDPKTLVSTDWLAKHIKDPDLRILDASIYLPGVDRNGRAEYEEAHIPGARFFDIDEISNGRSDLPHMVPPIEKFMSRMRAMGVGDGHQVVVYDGSGLFSAARVWWLFRLMGQNNVAVLDGGFPKWQAEGREIEDMAPVVRDRHMTVRFQNQMLRDVTQVSSASKLGGSQIVDARAAARFRGEAPEPREGLRSGHIPGSRNVPFTDLLNENNTMKSTDQTRAVFETAGVDLSKSIITSCGSGVTAAILGLALTRMGHDDWSLYDGSWAEWGMFPTVPVATGEA